jgi:crotonobetainyl-CoA:carnitine CoA-transferase CaiB-like acyl-CoA transferase
MIVPYRGYATKDGFIVIAAGNDRLFASFARVLGHPEWTADPRFCSNPDRVKNKELLYRSIEHIILERTTAEWTQTLDAAGVPNAPMQTIAQVLDHPQTRALGMLQESPQRDITLLGLPLSFDGTRPAFRRRPPALGADTDQVLAQLDETKAERRR